MKGSRGERRRGRRGRSESPTSSPPARRCIFYTLRVWSKHDAIDLVRVIEASCWLRDCAVQAKALGIGFVRLSTTRLSSMPSLLSVPCEVDGEPRFRVRLRRHFRGMAVVPGRVVVCGVMAAVRIVHHVKDEARLDWEF